MGFWRAVDWQRPWLAPTRALGAAVCADLERGDSVAAALNRYAGTETPTLAAGPLRFVAHEALPVGEAYEAFIRRTGQVPTRDNLHDLFNGLVWLAFAPLKRRLNELQAAEIERLGIGATRGPVRDALTLFDENAVLWQAPPELVDALHRRDWEGLFVTRRSQWREARTTLFGHALMDKLVTPRKAITAHAWLAPQGVDAAGHFAATLTADALAAKPFLPLPVLGVPGWWQDNADAGFYADASVFRPARG
ncbi:MAG TPA: DUF3025 domain-containing protein [Albitalea sp.]